MFDVFSNTWPKLSPRASHKCLAIFLIFLLPTLGSAEIPRSGQNKDRVENWNQFQLDPLRFRKQPIEKVDKNGHSINGIISSPFGRHDIETGRFYEIKLRVRSELTKGYAETLTEIAPRRESNLEEETGITANLTDFLDPVEFSAKGLQPIFSLKGFEDKNLMKAALDETPWDSDYWPVFQGGLGARYAVSEYSHGEKTWDEYFTLTHGENSLGKVIKRGNALEIEGLSPSEKYDLLIGSPEIDSDSETGFLTSYVWNEGRRYRKPDGSVEEWMGICHGWAPASFMMPRPRKVISVKSQSAGRLRFFPDDLKGLASLLWATAPPAGKVLGSRCNKKASEITRDPANGRIIDHECFDVNPGVWHLAVVNQIGQARRSLVMDASWDYEVWNQPVSGYSYRYFNPQTGAKVGTLKDAMVSKAEFKADKFAKYRSVNSQSFVGIEMIVTYVKEVTPDHSETDSPARDRVVNAKYLYDVELDKNEEIIGGEWYQDQHPDFIWLPAANARALSLGDPYLPNTGRWNPSTKLPDFWRQIAIASALRFGQPLASILEPLLDEAHGKGD